MELPACSRLYPISFIPACRNIDQQLALLAPIKVDSILLPRIGKDLRNCPRRKGNKVI